MKPWVELTSEEVEEIENLPLSQNDYLFHFACAVSAKLKEKNSQLDNRAASPDSNNQSNEPVS